MCSTDLLKSPGKIILFSYTIRAMTSCSGGQHTLETVNFLKAHRTGNCYELDFIDYFDNPRLSDKIFVVTEEPTGECTDQDWMPTSPSSEQIITSMMSLDLVEDNELQEGLNEIAYPYEHKDDHQITPGFSYDLKSLAIPRSLSHHDVASESPPSSASPASVTRIHVHSIVVGPHSPYFFSLLSSSAEREIHLSVRPGQGQLFRKLIQSIYDPGSLCQLSVKDVLSIVELGKQYSCDRVVEKCEWMLNLGKLK